MNDREAAWAAVKERLPDGWRTGPLVFNPSRGRWEVLATSSPPPARLTRSNSVTGTGPDQLSAIHDLARRLSSRDGAYVGRAVVRVVRAVIFLALGLAGYVVLVNVFDLSEETAAFAAFIAVVGALFQAER